MKGESTQKYWDSLTLEQRSARLAKNRYPSADELVIRAHGKDGRKRWPSVRLQNEVLHDWNVFRRYQHFSSLVKNPEVLVGIFETKICDGCGQSETSLNCAGTSTRALNVDHDHKTLLARGALCNRCNNVIGRVSDDPVLLEKLAQYLRKNRSNS